MGGVLDRADSRETAGTAERSGWSGGVSGVRVEPLCDRADVAGRRRDFDGGPAGAAEGLNQRRSGKRSHKTTKDRKASSGEKMKSPYSIVSLAAAVFLGCTSLFPAASAASEENTMR